MNKINFPWLFAIIPAAMVFFAGCMEPDDTGLGVLPQDDLVNVLYLDTFGIELETFILDSSRTSGLDDVLFGSAVDPEFGRIDAKANLQFVLPSNKPVTFGDTSLIKIDSIFLRLDLSDIYGRHENPIQIQVFEIIDPTFHDSVVYNNQDTLMVDMTNDLANGYIVDFSGFQGFFDIAIPLDISLAEKIMYADTDSLISNDVFKQYFGGLQIRATPVSNNQKEAGAIYLLDVTSGATKITMHYQLDTIPGRTYELVLDNDAPWFHSMSRSEVSDKLLGLEQPSSADPDAKYQFVQEGMAVGFFAKILGIESLYPVGINRAELVLKVDETFLGSSERYTPPNELYLFLADSTGRAIDENFFAAFGQYNSAEKEYKIPLSNNLSRIIKGDQSNLGFVILPGLPGNRGDRLNRAVIGGNGHPTLSPEFRVTFTSLPK